MTTEDVVIPEADQGAEERTASPDRRERLRSWAAGLRPAWKALIAFGLYQALAFWIWVVPILPRFGTQHIGGGMQDSRYYRWALTWTPWALAHNVNPLHSDYVFAPGGVSLAWSAFIPGPALLTWPITAVFGSLASLNLLMAVAPALAAWAAYLVCHRLTHRFWPSLLGGYLFGFSAYIAGNQIGFVNLILIFPVPLLVYLVIRRVEGSLGPVAFVAGFAACLVALFSISTELFGTAAIFLAIAYLIALAAAPIRRTLLRTGVLILLAGAIAAVFLFPYVAAVVTNRPDQALNPPELLPAADLWTFAAPPPYILFANKTLNRFALDHMQKPILDGVAYVGIGAIVLLLGFALTEWRRRETWALLAFVGIVAILSMGPILHVSGMNHGRLPGSLLAKAPLIQSAIPARFGAYTALAIGVIAAIWLARASGRFGWVRWAIALVAAAMILPAAPHHSPPATFPTFFSSDTVRQVIHPGENVYAITYERGDELVWQQDSGYWFKLAEGYLGPLPPELRTGPEARGLNMKQKTVVVPVPGEFGTWIRQHQVSVVILDDRAASRFLSMVQQSAMEQVYAGEGVTVWRPTGGPLPNWAS